jgi:hypothetical protein
MRDTFPYESRQNLVKTSERNAITGNSNSRLPMLYCFGEIVISGAWSAAYGENPPRIDSLAEAADMRDPSRTLPRRDFINVHVREFLDPLRSLHQRLRRD